MNITTKNSLTDLFLLTLFFALAYGLYLGGYSLFTPDDARYLEISREMARSGDYLTPRLEGLKYFEKPPLFYWLDAFAIDLGGNSLWVGRSVNALFALCGCLIMYVMGRSYFDRTTGSVAASVLGSSLLYIGLARYVTLDMTFTFCLSTSLLTFLRAYLLAPSSAKRVWCYIAYIFAALAVLAKGLIGIVLPIGIIGLWVLVRWDWQSLRYFYIPSGLLLFLIIALPWHILMQVENPEFFDYYIIFHHFLRYATMVSERYEPFWFFIPIILLGLLPWIVFLPGAIRNIKLMKWRDDPIISFLVVWFIFIFVFFSISKSKLVPYILPVVPAMALFITHYLVESYRKKQLPVLPLYILGILSGFFLCITLSATFWLPEQLTKYQGMLPYLNGIILIYLFTVLIGATIWKKQKFLAGIMVLVLGSIVSISATIITLEPFVNSKSTKTFADYLLPILQPQDIIVSYNTSYYDLSYYLDRVIFITHPKGELEFGAQQEPQNPHLISPDELWKIWNSPQRVFIVTKPDQYDNFQQHGHKIWLLSQTPRDVLLANQPIESLQNP